MKLPRWSKPVLWVVYNLVVVTVILWWVASAHAVTLPTLPQATVDTTYSLPTGTTFTPVDSAAFATALTNANLNDVIVLTAGVTYTGPFTLPNKTTGSGWIYITSSAYASLPGIGVRVAPANAANMPIIEGTSSPIVTADTAHHFRFVGIQFRPTAGHDLTSALIRLGNADTATATMPHHIVIDRCYIHGDPTVGSRRGVSMDGPNIAVINSYVSDFKENGSDTQALWAYNSPGPLKIDNDYLEASGENVMFGGSDPAMANLVPSDITITRNYFFKPLAWITENSPTLWTVKNLLEFKNAQRILVEGNLFENIWAAAQTGFLMNFKSVNQSGGCTWCVSQDLTFRNNRGKNLENGLSLAGNASDGGLVALATARVLIDNCELQIANVANGIGFGIFFGDGNSGAILTNTTVRHSTIVGVRAVQGVVHLEYGKVDQVMTTDLNMTNNLFEGVASLFGLGHGEGTVALDALVTNGSMTYDIWQGRNSTLYGAASGPGNTMANNFFPATQAAIGFVDYANHNYRLTSASPYHNAASDGTDVGANINAIDAAIGGVVYHPLKFVLLITTTSSTPISAGVPVPNYATLTDCNNAGKLKVAALATPVAMRAGQRYQYQCLPVES